MKKILLCCVLLLFVLDKTPSFGASREIHKQVLNNGITLITKENHAVPLIAVQVFIKTGLLHEPESQAGIANFTHQLLLKGTHSRTAKEIAETIESLGGNLDSGVEADFSNVTLVILKENLDQGLEILLDILQNSALPPDEVEKERKEILLAIEGRYDDPFTEAYDLLLKGLYGKHPYGRPDIGTQKSIKSLRRADLVHFYQKNFISENMIVAAVGDFPKEVLVQKLTKAFTKLPKQSLAHALEIPPLQTQGPLPTMQKKRKDLKASWTLFGFLAPNVSDPNYATVKVLHSIVGGGMSSKLYVKLREEKGLAYALGSFFPSRLATSHLVLYAQSSPKNQLPLKVGIETELAHLQTEKLSETEIAGQKQALIGDYLAAHQSMGSQAWYLGWWELLGKGAEFDPKYPGLIESVKPSDLKRMIQQIFNNPTRVLLQPK